MGVTVALSSSSGWVTVLLVMLLTGFVVGTFNGVLIVKGHIRSP